MRIVMGFATFMTMAAHPAFASEAFITQLSGKGAVEQATAALSKTAAAMLALPLQPSAINSSAQTAVAGSNSSSVAQFGKGNLASVVQAGGGNLSSVVQHGSGNQAVVTQRQGAH
jgi:hypothetical protein